MSPRIGKEAPWVDCWQALIEVAQTCERYNPAGPRINDVESPMSSKIETIALVPDQPKLTLRLPATAEDVQKLEAAAAELSAILPDIIVTDDETYAVADDLLTQGVQLLDAAKTCRASVTGPVYAAIREVEARFKPGMVQLTDFAIAVKKRLGDYRLAVAAAAKAERDAAAEAAATGDAEGLVQALNTADALAQKPADAGARVKFRWVAKLVNAALLPDDYWCPDMEKIQARASAHGGANEEPPYPIPGVLFERVADVAARH